MALTAPPQVCYHKLTTAGFKLTKSSVYHRAWVTGGNRGIGAAISTKLMELGLDVRALGSAELDLSNRESRVNFLETTSDCPDVLILNAGINEPEIFELQSDEAINRILEVNYFANINILQKVLPQMKKNNFGRIVAVSSLFAHRAKSGRSAYASSKAALEALIRHIAIESAPFGIMANIVSPGYVDTDLTRKNNSESQISELEKRIPVGRLAHPHEIAAVVGFLASGENSYITGQTLNVDGGATLL